MKEKINGININYEIYGQDNSEVLLILHGWGGQINSMLPIIESYKDRYKIIAVDFPGHGLSDIVDSWNVTDYMEHIYALLVNLDISKCSIIGHSFGGRVGILLSSTYPTLVNKLILVDSGGIIPKRSLKYYVKVYGYKLGKHVMKLVIHNKDKYEQWLESERQKRGSSDYTALDPRMRATFVKVVNQDLKPYLKKIVCPTLIVWGEFDKDTPLYMGVIMNVGIKNSKLIVLENTGHFSYLDDFNSFKKHVDEFIG